MSFKEPDCGGCKAPGAGAHSRRCRTQPGWMWYRFEDMAEELADLIGSNDAVASNLAYAIAGRMRAKANTAVRGVDLYCIYCRQPIDLCNSVHCPGRFTTPVPLDELPTQHTGTEEENAAKWDQLP